MNCAHTDICSSVTSLIQQFQKVPPSWDECNLLYYCSIRSVGLRLFGITRLVFSFYLKYTDRVSQYLSRIYFQWPTKISCWETALSPS